MTTRPANVDAAPWWVPAFTPFAKALLMLGVPLGPNGLITIRGRTSGEPRTTPVAIISVSGRRWVWAPWGDVHWVRNLRAAGHATLTVRRREEVVHAVELDEEGRLGFFRDVMAPLARSVPGGTTFIRVVDGVDLDDPVEASRGRPVFELEAVERVGSADASIDEGAGATDRRPRAAA